MARRRRPVRDAAADASAVRGTMAGPLPDVLSFTRAESPGASMVARLRAISPIGLRFKAAVCDHARFSSVGLSAGAET